MSAHLQLEPEDEESVNRMVASGRFPSREAVIAEGVRLVRARDEWLSMVEAKVAEGRAQIARGEGLTIDQVFDPLLARYRTWPR